MAENESERLDEVNSSEMEEEIAAQVEAEESDIAEESTAEESTESGQMNDEYVQSVDEPSSEEEISDSQDVVMEPEAAEAEASDAEPDSEERDPVSGAIEEQVDDDSDRYWFVVHCYSGYENKVRHNLEQRIETMGMKSKIFDVVVPTEEEIEIKDGKRRTVERRVFPGYILVQMIMDEDSWYVVRNTPGVTGFVGMGNEPTPLRPEEVNQIVRRMEAEAPRIKVTYSAGQKVRIIDGPFNDFIGTVSEIDMDRAKVRVMVSFFGRETPVELDFLQVEKA
jgi:transcriptional antiterminator NusG